MQFLIVANKYKDLLQEEINWLEKAIKKSPPGRLKINKSGTRYKWINQLEDGTRQYIRKKDIKLAGLLAAKGVYKRKLIETRQELSGLMVRSKSEAFIANELSGRGIPFRIPKRKSSVIQLPR